MEVEQIDLKLLSEALGELARGFKKLKTVVDGLKISGVKVPIPEISGQNVSGVSRLVSTVEADCRSSLQAR